MCHFKVQVKFKLNARVTVQVIVDANGQVQLLLKGLVKDYHAYKLKVEVHVHFLSFSLMQFLEY